MDVSASEAEERGLASPGGISLERVTKEQLYAAYRRTQDKYGRYRTRYADLARHYKLLERDNAKARVILLIIIWPMYYIHHNGTLNYELFLFSECSSRDTR